MGNMSCSSNCSSINPNDHYWEDRVKQAFRDGYAEAYKQAYHDGFHDGYCLGSITDPECGHAPTPVMR